MTVNVIALAEWNLCCASLMYYLCSEHLNYMGNAYSAFFQLINSVGVQKTTTKKIQVSGNVALVSPTS